GKRVARAVPVDEVGTYPRPLLRIVDADLWQAVKQRQLATRKAMTVARVRGRRPLYLFSGLTTCGTCGGGFTMAGRDDLKCFNATKRATCTNRRIVKRATLEARVLRALQERFLADERAFRIFADEFTA